MIVGGMGGLGGLEEWEGCEGWECRAIVGLVGQGENFEF